MVGDDLEADVAGAKSCGLQDDPRPDGQVPRERAQRALVKPDAVVDSLGDVPDYLARAL